MLNSTFLHIDGIGAKTEKALWANGVTTLDGFAKKMPKQLNMFKGGSNPLELSMDALQRGDADYFASVLESREYYRIALSCPNDVLFLDIETTGLSLYYDKITLTGWSVNRHFDILLADDDHTKLAEALNNAKVLVTFNGTQFDLKFLAKAYPDLNFPKAHIDLRYFCKRVGMKGGQKAIENEIGLNREIDVVGENAPVLWHEYRRGDEAALQTLIEYNHADVEGMKAIFEHALQKYLADNEIPEKIVPAVSFANKIAPLKFAQEGVAEGFCLPEYKGSNKPVITYSELDAINPLNELVVIGIDLVSSEERESGYCILNGNQAETSRVKDDQSMIDMAIDAGADLISIDSPLSLPVGRTSYFDDDPMREQYGITRECERILAKRGIKSYPTLIQSMQKLTKRGVELAEKFRKLGIPVIESYPGAAQDIMQIPRKQSGIKYLTNGLAEFGITGHFLDEQVTHDELDAITSAIVGLFFWAGKFEALGNMDENHLYIPDVKVDPTPWLNRKVIGLCGEIAAGKTTMAKHLKDKGFEVARYSQVLEGLLKVKGQAINRQSLQSLGEEINQDKGQRWLGRQVVEGFGNATHCVVDGVRFLEDRAFLAETFGPAFRLVYVDANEEIRQKRNSKSSRENLTYQLAAKSMTESQVSCLQKIANKCIKNNLSLNDFYGKIDSFQP